MQAKKKRDTAAREAEEKLKVQHEEPTAVDLVLADDEPSRDLLRSKDEDVIF